MREMSAARGSYMLRRPEHGRITPLSDKLPDLPFAKDVRSLTPHTPGGHARITPLNALVFAYSWKLPLVPSSSP